MNLTIQEIFSLHSTTNHFQILRSLNDAANAADTTDEQDGFWNTIDRIEEVMGY